VTDSRFLKLTGFMFILTPLWLFANLRVLAAVSNFPDSQFQGVDVLLRQVAASGVTGILVWYVDIVPGVLYIVSVVLFHRVITQNGQKFPWFGVATNLGVCAWAIQLIGLVRWIFVFPYLAKLWVNAPSDTTKETITIVFNAFSNYAGFALGQTIGIGLTAAWILLVGIAILHSPLFKPWLGWVAIVTAIGEFIGNIGPLGTVVESIDIKTFFNISGLFWYISYAWMAYLGVVMMRSKWTPAAA
jgi:hypothetical protein